MTYVSPVQIDVLRTRRREMFAQRDQLMQNLDRVLDSASAEKRDLRASEAREFDRCRAEVKHLDDQIREVDERVEELRSLAVRQGDAAEARRLSGDTGLQSGYASPRGGDVYRPGDTSTSFFKDLRASKLGDVEAGQRLQANNNEQRALGNTGGAGGSGGEFAPPGWLVADFVALARAGRVLADRCVRDVLPAGVSSVNIPKVSTGTSTAIQSTQNTALASTDPTTTSLTSPIVSIGGKNVVSQQLLDQSAIPFDRMILGDLAADYARSLGSQVISGTGAGGQLNGVLTFFTASGTSNVTFTQASPAVTGAGGFYSNLNKAISNVSTSRFLPPNAIVMHPRRWSWVAAAFDSTGRPLVSPSGNAFNQIADAATVAAQGPVGEMAGLPVYVDPNIPTNLGVGTNQDPVFVGKFDDLYLWENGPTMASFDQPYADSAGVLFRALGYSAFIPSRYASSVSVISGTGCTPPVY